MPSSRVIALGLLTLAVSLGCRRTAAPSSSTDASGTVPSDAAPDLDGAATGGGASPSVLGEPCDPARSRLTGAKVLCSRGRVAATYVRHGDRFDGIESGDQFEVLYAEQHEARGRSLRVSARGDVLVATAVDCGTCAAILGWSFAGKVADVDRVALRTLACRVSGRSGYDLALHKISGWRALLAQRRLEQPSRECADTSPPIFGAAEPATTPSLLGEPCKKAPEDTRETVCVKGRIAGLYARLRTVEQGDAFDVLYSGNPKIGRDGRGIREFASDLEVAVRGDTLVVHQTDCRTCAAVLGWSFAGSLENLRDADLRALACRVLGRSGRGSDLRSARAWQSLLELEGPDPRAPSADCANVATF